MLRFAWRHKWFPIKALLLMLVINTSGTMMWLIGPKIEAKTGIDVRPTLSKALDLQGVALNGAYDVTSSLLKSSWNWENMVLAAGAGLVMAFGAWKWQGRFAARDVNAYVEAIDRLKLAMHHLPSSDLYVYDTSVGEVAIAADKACRFAIENYKEKWLRSEDTRFKKRCEKLPEKLDSQLATDTPWDPIARGKAITALAKVVKSL